ncbi:MAG: hypothetical protein R3236_02120, partial [Phycisphaeraceae bacterium]|nr:hypothetical protein [Phycisphaeraceae bacterium]
RPDGRLELTGRMGWSEADMASQLKLKATGLYFEDQIMDLISADRSLRAFWEQRRPVGRFDAAVSLTMESGRLNRYTIRLRPENLGFVHQDRRYRLRNIDGGVTFRPDRLELEDLSGTFAGGTTLKASGAVHLGRSKTPDRMGLKLEVVAPKLSSSIRDLMPQVVRETVDQIQLTGGGRVTLDRLQVRGGTGGKTHLVEGTLVLKDAALQFGVPIERFSGRVKMKFDGTEKARTMRLEVDAKTMRLEGQPIRNATLKIKQDQSGRLTWNMSRGSLYGGRLSGRGAVDAQRGVFESRLLLIDAPLQKLLQTHSRKTPENSDQASARKKKSEPVRGLLSATLVMEGAEDGSNQRGRGVVLIRDTELSGLPLVVGMAQLTHLALPVVENFDRAAIAYRIHGSKILFEKIRLISPTMELVGAGSMERSTGDLDVRLKTHNPRGLDFGPLTSVIDLGRDQLFAVHISGTLKDPKVDLEKFSELRRAWERVFQPKQAQKRASRFNLSDGG